MEIIEKRRRIREEVIKEAKEWALKLKGKYSVAMIGSYARGDFNRWSDVDLVVISDFKGNPLERLKNFDLLPGYEIIALNFEEFERLKKRKDPIIKEIMDYKVILRDDCQLFDHIELNV